MQCFVHSNLPASVVCKKCGKAMCVDCSAFANHSGFCPNCRKDSVEEAIRKLNGIKKANVWTVLILALFVAGGTCAVYFLDVISSPLVFLALAAVPLLLVYLAVKLKKLRADSQGLFANLAQIKLTLAKALPQAGVLNPLNIYQDVDACKTSPREQNWAQLAFLEPVPEEIPTYSAGTSEDAEHAQAAATVKAAPLSDVPDIAQLQIAAGKLIAEDDIFEGQITFREVIEDLIKVFNKPVEEYADDGESPRLRAPRPAARKPLPPRGRPAPPRPVSAQKTEKPAAASAERPAPKVAAAPEHAQPKAGQTAHNAQSTVKPAEKPAAPPPPRPRPVLSEEEKKTEKERAEVRKELDKLRLQINELYYRNK